MSNELLSQLENRVTSAVDTIEDLRAEVRVLREERELLENKLRDLLAKIENVGNNGAQAEAGSDNAAPNAGEGQGESHTPSPFGQPHSYGSSDF